MRLSVEHRDNRAVANLAKSLHLPNHNANLILTREVSDKVIGDTMNLLRLQSFLDKTDSPLEILTQNFGTSKSLTLAGHLLFKGQFGNNYNELDFINLSKETIRKYDRECARLGISSLE